MIKRLKMLFALLIFALSTISISAHPGNLRRDSIVECNGKQYGNHIQKEMGEIHWHIAIKNKDGSFGQEGPSLGLSNPCGTVQDESENKTPTPSETIPPEISNQENDAERKIRIENEAKIENARLDKIKKDEEERTAREEQERVLKEKTEADLVKKLAEDSSIEYLSVTIDDYNYSKFEMLNKDMFLVHNSPAIIEVKFKQQSSKFTYKQDKDLDYFEKGIINLKLVSSNEVNTESKQLAILRMPTQKDLYSMGEFSFLIGDNIYNINDQKLKLPFNNLEEIEMDKLKFAYSATEISLDYHIELKKNDDSEDILHVNILGIDQKYEIPIKFEKSASYLMFPILGLIAGISTIFYKKKNHKNIKNVPSILYPKPKSDRLVSVVIPSYESSDSVINTIESVLNQSYSNLEIIIIDSKTEDSVIDKIRKISRVEKRITLLEKTIGKGIVELRDVGINASKADYVAFIQEGDEWQIHKIEKQLDFMLTNKANFTYSDYSILELKTEAIIREVLTPDKITLDLLPGDEVISWSSIMFNQKKVGEIDLPFYKKNNEEAYLKRILKRVETGYRVSGISFKRYQRATLVKRLKSKIFK